MTHKVEYEFKKDSLKRKYALRVDLVTGKKERIEYKLAQKRASGLKYDRKKADYKAKVLTKMAETGAGGTWEEYLKMSDIVETELIKKRSKEKGAKPLTKAEIRARVKKTTIEHRTGYASRMRYAWTYKPVIERYFDEETGEEVIICDSPVFVARGLKRNGDEFERMCSVCQDAYDRIKSLDLCSIDGGACVIFYNKSDKEVIKQFELGKGCGFSFDFTNYSHEDKDNNYDEGEYDWL